MSSRQTSWLNLPSIGATPPLIGWAGEYGHICNFSLGPSNITKPNVAHMNMIHIAMDSTQYFALANFRLLLQEGDPSKPLSIPQHALAGLGAGFVVPLVATPVELLKSKLQVQYDKATRKYSGPIDCARQLIRQNGRFALWYGIIPNVSRSSIKHGVLVPSQCSRYAK